MRIAILGARGTVGGFLYNSLKGRYNVTGVTRDDVDLRDSLQVFKYFCNNAYDVVFNAAINPVSNLNAPISVAQDNFTMFTSLYNARNVMGKVIHFGSGAEFDQARPIVNAREEEIYNVMPTDPYGMSKNVTTRFANSTENWHTLRFFGVFHPTELPRRLLPKIKTKQPITINDKYFDYMYLEDLLPVAEMYINETPMYKDMNLVYPTKMLLSDFVKRFCSIHGLSQDHITYGDYSDMSYTGNGDSWQELNLPTLGIDYGLTNYK